MDELKNIKVSEQEKSEIKKDSPDTLPLNPTAQGFSGAEIRRRLSKSITGEKGSVLSLFVDKMDILSDLFHMILDENDDESLIEQIKKIDADIENILLELVNKVDKENIGNRIYGTTPEAQQTSYALEENPNPSSIPFRDSRGAIKGATASANQDLVPLEQLNASLNEKANKDDINLSVKIDYYTITRTDNNELQVSKKVINDINSRTKNNDFVAYQQLVQDFLNDKLDKKPDGVIDLINAFNKIDTRYLEIDNELFIVVLELPEIGEGNKIYLVPKTGTDNNNEYDEYIYINNEWEALGTITIDLSNYYNKGEVDGLLGAKVNANNPISAGTKTKITYDAKGLVTGGADLEESDIPPLSASKITQDANNRFVTDNEKSTWNEKQDALTNVTTSDIVTGIATTQKTVTAKAVHDAIMQIMFNSLGGES